MLEPPMLAKMYKTLNESDTYLGFVKTDLSQSMGGYVIANTYLFIGYSDHAYNCRSRVCNRTIQWLLSKITPQPIGKNVVNPICSHYIFREVWHAI